MSGTTVCLKNPGTGGRVRTRNETERGEVQVRSSPQIPCLTCQYVLDKEGTLLQVLTEDVFGAVRLSIDGDRMTGEGRAQAGTGSITLVRKK